MKFKQKTYINKSSLSSKIESCSDNIGSIKLRNCSLEAPSSNAVVKARKAPLALASSSSVSVSHVGFKKLAILSSFWVATQKKKYQTNSNLSLTKISVQKTEYFLEILNIQKHE